MANFELKVTIYFIKKVFKKECENFGEYQHHNCECLTLKVTNTFIKKHVSFKNYIKNFCQFHRLLTKLVTKLLRRLSRKFNDKVWQIL